MIHENAINEWSEIVPWISKKHVEQDLLICRALVAIYRKLSGMDISKCFHF
jgi:hypothetical protein